MNEVYLITNNINGKMYVGVTRRGYEVRFKEHINDAISGSTNLLHCAIRKYGADNFTISLVESNVPDERIEEREQYYIRYYNTFYINHFGYNMTEGGGGMVGYKHTEASRSQISKSLTGHVFPESRNAKIKSVMLGREYKEEWKRALSNSRKGRFTQSDNPFFGKHHSEATKLAISNANSKSAIAQLDVNTYEELRVFKNLNEAGSWVVANNLSQAQPTTCALRIGEVVKNPNTACTAYGYHWTRKEG